MTYVRRVPRTGASWPRRLRELSLTAAMRTRDEPVLDEIIPTLGIRDEARQVALTRGLHLGTTKVYVSTILRPRMDRKIAQVLPPYETMLFDSRDQPLMAWPSWNRAAAEACHRDVVDMHRYIQRARMRRCHQLYRRRRR